MSKVRVLVGTRKGAFILTSDLGSACHKNADGILGNHTILGTSFY
jgi:hypothetical protein